MRCDRAFKESATFCEVSAHPPEMSQCRGETDTLGSSPLALLFVKLDGLPQVRVVDLKMVKQLSLLAHVVPVGILSQSKIRVGVRLAYGVRLRQFPHPLLGELVDGLQHGKPRITAGAVILSQQAL